MVFDADPEVTAWLEDSFASEYPTRRRRAVELLEYIACPERSAMLERARLDPDMQVVATVELVDAVINAQPNADRFELMESAFSDGLPDDDLAWEWEYTVVGCPFGALPTGRCLVWTKQEDDGTAKRLGALKLLLGRPSSQRFAVAIVGKRLVTRFTRSPRSFAEAMLWHREGRPRYQ